jgi:hypothetical protein
LRQATKQFCFVTHTARDIGAELGGPFGRRPNRLAKDERGSIVTEGLDQVFKDAVATAAETREHKLSNACAGR